MCDFKDLELESRLSENCTTTRSTTSKYLGISKIYKCCQIKDLLNILQQIFGILSQLTSNYVHVESNNISKSSVEFFSYYQVSLISYFYFKLFLLYQLCFLNFYFTVIRFITFQTLQYNNYSDILQFYNEVLRQTMSSCVT